MGSTNFAVNILWGSKFIRVTHFGCTNFLGSTNLGCKTILVVNIFGGSTFFWGQTIFGGQNCKGVNKCWGYKNVGGQEQNNTCKFCLT